MTHEMSFSRSQRGVALIVTLFILLVVTFMGLVAMRTGLMQVAMATNSQVSVVLFQNADAGTGTVENVINSSSMAYANGPTGPITLIKDNPGAEVVGCLTKDGLVLATSVAAADKKKCDLDNNAQYVSGRNVVAVQVAVRTPVDASGKSQSVINYGTDESVLPGGGGALVAVYSTSVMPAFGSATTSVIEGCLNLPHEGTAGNTVTDCLTTNNASFQTVVQEFVYGYGGYK
ncbi:MAG: pilus assembly protein PilX [Moraxellaceae bacterium]|nr:pilus assembly protein PilX [Moraxellaceae bacterium]